MISVPADIARQSKHAANWLDGRKEQGPSPVLVRAKRQLEEGRWTGPTPLPCRRRNP